MLLHRLSPICVSRSNSLIFNFANKKNEYGKKYIQSAVLRERQQGERRYCPHHGTSDNQRYCGAGIPTLEANLNLSFGYKGFDLSIVLGSAWNFKLYNGNKYFYEGMNSKSNMLKSTLNAWTPDNRNTDVPRAVYQDPNGNMKESDRFLENGDFVRLRQAQLGYTLPKSLMQKFYIEKLRFYVSGENLFTITGYDGIDPEFSRASVLNTGVDKLIYPFTRSFTVGAQLTF